jgi:hypothetical protein
VIIKVGTTEQIQNEWSMFTKLHTNKIPGVLEVYCYFHCKQDFKLLRDNMDSLCTDTGDKLNILVMGIAKLGNLTDFKWKTNDALQSCIKQALLTVLQAYRTFGFFHEDCHGRNFLIKATTRKERIYTIAGERVVVPLFGYETFMMDHEGSKDNMDVRKFYTDILDFVYKLQNQMRGKINEFKVSPYITKASATRDKSPVLNIQTMLQDIDQYASAFELVKPIQGGNKAPWHRRKPKL